MFLFLYLLENAATPYQATVSINDMQYGVGYGTSKKQAKSDAAKATLEILIPEMRSKITADSKSGSNASKSQDQDLSVSVVRGFVVFVGNAFLRCSFSMKSEWRIQGWRSFVQKPQNPHRTIFS